MAAKKARGKAAGRVSLSGIVKAIDTVDKQLAKVRPSLSAEDKRELDGKIRALKKIKAELRVQCGGRSLNVYPV